jgi:tetratricopeptide (TPR) repeat protein
VKLAYEKLVVLGGYERLNCLTIVGPTGSGKSFLANCILRMTGITDKEFFCSKAAQGTTAGADMFSVPVSLEPHVQDTLVFDIEGLGHKNEAILAKLLLPVMMVSQVVVYNVSGRPLRNELLHNLSVLAHVAQGIAVSKDQRKPFGHLAVVLRDWAAEVAVEQIRDDVLGIESEANDQGARDRNRLRHTVEACFAGVSFHGLVPPFQLVKSLREDRIPWNDVPEDFWNGLGSLLKELGPHLDHQIASLNCTLSGAGLPEIFKLIVEQTSAAQIEPVSILTLVQRTRCEEAVIKAHAGFRKLVKSVQAGLPVVPPSALREKLESLKGQVVDEFSSGLVGIDLSLIAPQRAALVNQCDILSRLVVDDNTRACVDSIWTRHPLPEDVISHDGILSYLQVLDRQTKTELGELIGAMCDAECERVLEERLALRRQQLEERKDGLRAKISSIPTDNLRFLMTMMMQSGETAIPILQELVSRCSKLRGATHPEVLHLKVVLASAMADDLRLREDAVVLYEEVLGAADGELADQVRSNMAEALNRLGRYHKQEEVLVQLVSRREAEKGANHESSLRGRCNVAFVVRELGRYKEAESMCRAALERCIVVLGETHNVTLMCTENVAHCLSVQGKYADAEVIYRRVLEARKTRKDDENDLCVIMGNLAIVVEALGKYGEAEALQKEVLEKQRRILGEDHPHTFSTMSNLAGTFESQGRYGEAEALQKEVLEKERRILGEDHPHTLSSLGSLAGTFESQGRYGEAEALQKEVLEKERRILGEDHPHTLSSLGSLAGTFESQGRYGEAEALKKEVLEKERRILGEDHPRTVSSLGSLARTFESQGRYGEAEALQKEVLEKERRILGEDHPHFLTSKGNLAYLWNLLGKHDEARILQEQKLVSQGRILGNGHPDVAWSHHVLGMILESLARHEEALIELEPALSALSAVHDPLHPKVLWVKNSLGVTLCSLKKYEEAEALLREAVDGRSLRLGPLHPRTLWSVHCLAVALNNVDGREEEAAELRQKALEGMNRTP